MPHLARLGTHAKIVSMASLSKRQRSLLFGLGIANLILLTAAATLLGASDDPLVTNETPIATRNRSASQRDTQCREDAARALAEHSVAGSVALPPDGSIDFVLGGDDPADAWDALMISSELAVQRCGPYDPVRVDVSDPSGLAQQRLIVEARWADVNAWAAGQIDDATLSDRMQRTNYTLPDSPP